MDQTLQFRGFLALVHLPEGHETPDIVAEGELQLDAISPEEIPGEIQNRLAQRRMLLAPPVPVSINSPNID